MPNDRCTGGFAHPRWVYGALSGVVVAYVSGLLLAAGPGSDLVTDAYEVAYPALELANINNDWGFFSPDPGPGDLPRYEIIDGDGTTHRFAWMEALEGADPAYFRYTTLFVNVMDEPRSYGDAAARFLCRKHADLRPRKVVFTVAHQVEFTPEDILDGKGILDDMPLEKLYFRRCDEVAP